MAKNNNSNKGWGGPFDFNGDGKTTWDEEAFGLTLMEQCRKNNESSSYTPSHKTREPKAVPTIKPVPEVVDESNYSALLTDYRGECIGAIVAMVVFLIPAIFILWAVYSSYDPDNSASGFLIMLFTIAGLIYGGVVLSTTGKSLGTSLENIELVKKRYSGPAIQKNKKKKWWLWLIVPVIIIGVIIISSNEPTEDDDTGYTPSYNSYTSSGNSSYSSQGVTKKINTTPAMTKEEAERLRGTGYHGTRPNSTAENIELKAAQVKCKTCGMHSDNR
jgi:hypothetical protein